MKQSPALGLHPLYLLHPENFSQQPQAPCCRWLLNLPPIFSPFWLTPLDGSLPVWQNKTELVAWRLGIFHLFFFFLLSSITNIFNVKTTWHQPLLLSSQEQNQNLVKHVYANELFANFLFCVPSKLPFIVICFGKCYGIHHLGACPYISILFGGNWYRIWIVLTTRKLYQYGFRKSLKL